MHPRTHALSTPNKPALIIANTDDVVTYAQLDHQSNQVAHLFRRHHLKRGDVVAMMLENTAYNLSIAWGAQRSGLYLTCISTKLSAEDFAYILKNSDAKLVITSVKMAEKYQKILTELSAIPTLSVGGKTDVSADWSLSVKALPTTPIHDESHGGDMLYSSGTTGRPKGVKPDLIEGPIDQTNGLVEMGRSLYNMDENTRFFSPAPLYHAAPLRWCMAIQKLGGTVVISDKFNEEQALSIIEKYEITHAQWVPTHFYRLLNLPEKVRRHFDHSSLIAVFHAAAPCPPSIKKTMIDWWGPIVHEYYSGTECPGITAISAEEWLKKPGSVGKAILGQVRVCDDHGSELPKGATGIIYFSDGPSFAYHNDPEKTRNSHNEKGWATMGDVGFLDDDGYLFLTDRKDFMIISGGVNIYPQEVENCLMAHPAISDAAVMGLPDDEMGEKVVAIVVPSRTQSNQTTLEEALEAFCIDKIGRIKSPRTILIRDSIPRLPTGKIQKNLLRKSLMEAEQDPEQGNS